MTGRQDQGPAPVHVVGAGIVGVSTALHLLRRGVAVTLVDREEPGEGASYGNAGVVATGSIVPVPVPGLWMKAPGMLLDPLGPLYLRWPYLPRLAPWLLRYLANSRAQRVRRISAGLAELLSGSLDEHRALAKGTGAEGHIHPRPYGFVYRDRRAFEADAFAWNLRREHGYAWRELEGPDVRAAEPDLAPDYRFLVLVEDQHGFIDRPGDYVKALAAAFIAEGGRFEKREVRALRLAGNRIAGLVCAEGEVAVARLVLAAGAWSARLAATAGLKIPLESERGYHVELIRPSLKPRHPLMIAEGKFVVTPMSERLRAAGLVEFGGLEGPPSAAPVQTLLRRIARVFPSLRYEGHSTWLGHRPATPDSLPLIGASDTIEGLFMAFGHQHIGLTSGPKTGRWLAEAMAGGGGNIDMSPFAVGRFRR